MTKLSEVKTFESSHDCEIKKIRQLNFDIFNFFFQVNLIKEMPSK